MTEIVKALKGWLPRPDSVRAWEMFIAYRVLPYAGGYYDQPAYILEDFNALWLLQEWHELNNALANPATLPPVAGFIKANS